MPDASLYEGDHFWAVVPEKMQNPYADFIYFRENKPVYFHEGLGQWFVFRHDDVSHLFGDPRLSSDRLAGMRPATPEEARPALDKISPYFDSWVLMVDADKHRRLRGLLHTAFNASVVERLRGNIEQSVNELLDQAQAKGHFDACEDYAFLLSAYVLADLLGVLPEDREKVVKWSMDFIDYFNIAPITVENTHKMVDSGLDLIAHTRQLIQQRRAHPADDFLGSLVKAAESGDGQFTEDEMVSNTMLLLLAGHIAVRNFIGNIIWLLFEHPEQFALLQADPSLLGSAIEEGLRYETPVAAIPRIALEDFEYKGQSIRKGQLIQLLMTSANRDPEAYPDPERFDITRKPGKTLSFGHGPHTCLGAMLARMETAIAIESLYRRMPNLRIDSNRPITWYRNLGNRGPIHLPVVF